MKTVRLYENDAYGVNFQARVIETQEIDGKWGVVLDRSAFYPTGGGQPHDTGFLNEFTVIDVQEHGEILLHCLKQGQVLEPGVDVHGRVNWERRFDHMQQHSGQHLLSAAFYNEAKANTRGFHLGSDGVTIDLDMPDISWTVGHAVEAWANQAIWANRPVLTHLVDEQRREAIPFRRQPKVAGDLRVVEVVDTDWSACCGTHVAATGEIGLIKIHRLENYKGGTRVHFVCGGRALASAQAKQLALDAAARLLSASEDEVTEAVQRLQLEGRELRKQLRECENKLLNLEAARLAQTAEAYPGFSLICAQLDVGDMKILQQMARVLTAAPGRVVLMGVVQARTSLVLARSEDVDLDVRPPFQAAMALFEGKGGGSEMMCQGSGAPINNLNEIFTAVKKILST